MLSYMVDKLALWVNRSGKINLERPGGLTGHSQAKVKRRPVEDSQRGVT